MEGGEDRDDAEQMRKLAETRTLLEKQIAEAEANLKSLKILLEFVNKTLLKSGFRRAEVPKPGRTQTLPSPRTADYGPESPLKTGTGELLARLQAGKNSMRVTVAEDKTFNVHTPPFQQFLVERVLDKMKEKDSEAAQKGQLAQDKVFSYQLLLDGDIIRGIDIHHLTSERVRELKSSIRWTLEKMYEKTDERS